MSFFTFFFRSPKDPRSHYLDCSRSESCNLSGRFDFSKNLITGWAQDLSDPDNRGLRIFVFRDKEILASAPVNERDEVGWHFEIPLDASVSPQDILHERVRVVVCDKNDDVFTLRLEGATQLALISEFVADSTPPYLLIDFRKGGNNDLYLREGWSGQEQTHRWTTGMQSALALPPPRPEYDGIVEILLWPFTAGPWLTTQDLRVLVNGMELANLSIQRQSFLKFAIPRTAFLESVPTVIRFFHPNAQSPAILGISKDTRLLGFAFKRFTIRQNGAAGLANFGSAGNGRECSPSRWINT